MRKKRNSAAVGNVTRSGRKGLKDDVSEVQGRPHSTFFRHTGGGTCEREERLQDFDILRGFHSMHKKSLRVSNLFQQCFSGAAWNFRDATEERQIHSKNNIPEVRFK